MDMNAAKNQRESFESAVTSDDSFVTASEGLIATEEMDNVEDYPLLKCTAPSEGQALPTVNVRQSNVLHFGHEKEGIGKSGTAKKEDYSLLKCTAPLQGQALLAVNAGQSNVLPFGHEEEVLAGLGMPRRTTIHYWSALHPYKGRHSLQ